MILFSILNRNLQQLRICLQFQENECGQDNLESLTIQHLDSHRISISAAGKESLLVFPASMIIPAFPSSPVAVHAAGQRLFTFSIPVSGEVLVEPEWVPSAMPANPELMNDWLFCHNHAHGDHHAEHEPQLLSSTTSSAYIIRTADQLCSFLREKGISSQILLESRTRDGHHKDSLLVRILNAGTIILVSDACMFGQVVHDLTPQHVILLQFELMNDTSDADDRLRRQRQSFDVEWMQIEPNLLSRLHHHLKSSSNSTLIPDTSGGGGSSPAPDHQIRTGFVSIQQLKQDDGTKMSSEEEDAKVD